MIINSTTHCAISLNNLELAVHLGLSENERSHPQCVNIDVTINYLTPPLACITDQITDTYCYDKLAEDIKQTFALQTFNLLEHLGYSIYQRIKHLLTLDAKINIAIRKKPQIVDLIEGVTFYYGDSTFR